MPLLARAAITPATIVPWPWSSLAIGVLVDGVVARDERTLEIRMARVDAGVENSDDRLRRAGRDAPGADGVDLRERPRVAPQRIVRDERGRRRPGRGTLACTTLAALARLPARLRRPLRARVARLSQTARLAFRCRSASTLPSPAPARARPTRPYHALSGAVRRPPAQLRAEGRTRRPGVPEEAERVSGRRAPFRYRHPRGIL